MHGDLVRIVIVRAVLFCVPVRGRGCEPHPGAGLVFSLYCRTTAACFKGYGNSEQVFHFP